MSDKTYTIRPLEWKCSLWEDSQETMPIQMMKYRITRQDGPGIRRWRWLGIFVVRGFEEPGFFAANTEEEIKSQCEEHFKTMLMRALKEAT